MASTAAIGVPTASSKFDSILKPESQAQLVFRRFRRHKLAVVSLVIIAIVFMASLMAPFIAPFERDYLNPTNLWQPIGSIDAATGKVHVLGTDHVGHDVFTRMLYGGRVTLTIAVVVATLECAIGVFVGSVAGFYRGQVDAVLMRVLDFFASLPDFPILLIMSSILVTDPKLIPFPKPLVELFKVLFNFTTGTGDREARQCMMIMAILTLFGWTFVARLMRAQVLQVRELEFIDASRALGTSNVGVILRHVIPNAIPPVIVAFSQALAGAFLTETVLSFLGFGVQDPVATWGNMMKIAEENIFLQRTFPLIVGTPILICSLCFNFIGDGLRDALDPRAKI